MRKVIILQARLASSRFPNKVLADLHGRPMIAHIIDRLKESRAADSICAAIPADSSEDKLAAALAHHGVTITRGHATDVLGRYIQAAYQTGAQIIVRATADNPLVSPENIDRQIEALSADPECDYVFTDNMPLGVSTETFTLKTLEKLDYLSREGNLREHVTLYLRQHPGTFNALHLDAPAELRHPELRLTVDTPSDFELLSAIYSRLHKAGSIVNVADAVRLLQEEPASCLSSRRPEGVPEETEPQALLPEGGEARTVWECPWWRVEEEAFTGPDGVQRNWYTARRPSPETVHMLAIDSAGLVPLLYQYRVPMHAWVWELPAGICDNPAESLEETARRELLEETGFHAGRLIHLLRGTVSPGLTDEAYNAYLCLDLDEQGPGGGIHGESIEVSMVPLVKLEGFVLARAAAGELVDAKIIAHIRLAQLWLASKPVDQN